MPVPRLWRVSLSVTPSLKCLPSARLGVCRLWPYVAILSKHVNSYRLVVTHASSGDHKVTDRVLSGLIAEVENDPVLYKETCTVYIERLCGSGNVSDAARLLQSLHDKHIFLGPRTYNLLLTVVREAKSFELFSQIFKDALVSCNFLNQTFYSTLAKAFLNSTDSVPLLQFVGEVAEMKCPKSTIIINRIITGFAESKQTDKALLIFDLMKGLNCKPDLVTYNIVLDILGRVGQIDEMLHAFASMKESSLIPDIISYNTLINSFRKFGRLDLCVFFLQEMSENGVDPDLRTYTAVIDSFGRLGHIKEALGYFGQMKRRGIHPSIYIYRSLISTSKKAEKLDLASRLLEEMNTSVSEFSTLMFLKRNICGHTFQN